MRRFRSSRRYSAGEPSWMVMPPENSVLVATQRLARFSRLSSLGQDATSQSRNGGVAMGIVSVDVFSPRALLLPRICCVPAEGHEPYPVSEDDLSDACARCAGQASCQGLLGKTRRSGSAIRQPCSPPVARILPDDVFGGDRRTALPFCTTGLATKELRVFASRSRRKGFVGLNRGPGRLGVWGQLGPGRAEQLRASGSIEAWPDEVWRGSWEMRQSIAWPLTSMLNWATL